MNTKISRWVVGTVILLGSIVANAETGFHEEGFIDVSTTVFGDTTFTHQLDRGLYSLSLSDYGLPDYFVTGSLGVQVYSGINPLADFAAGSYSGALDLAGGLYTFHVYGDASNALGVGSFGLTVAPVPEPNTAMLLFIGTGFVLGYARKRKHAPAISTENA
ncbi:MAG: PEP-CTERM sorting domain-containing protein [Methylophilaceae bacterium]